MVLFLLVLVGEFIEVGYISKGATNYGKLNVLDADRDSLIDIIFTPPIDSTLKKIIYFYEQIRNDSFKFVARDSILMDSIDLVPFDMGDFDRDGKLDFAMFFGFQADNTIYNGISIYESPDSFSYPLNEVWRDTVGFALVIPICVYDIDKDDFPEIIFQAWKKDTDSGTVVRDFGIYEWSVVNNNYELIFLGDTLGDVGSTVAFGDFDLDGLNEFVFGGVDGYYQIWESISDDNYILREYSLLPTANIKDCFTVNDMDSDGRLEFIVKGFTVLNSEFQVFIFEAIGNNSYEVIDTFYFVGTGQGYSASGDIDGDSVPEAVLMTRPWIRILKASSNNNFYVFDSIYVGYNGSVAIYDIDGNGLNEIIWSGNDTTRIFEWDGTGISEGLRVKNKNIKFKIPAIVGALSLPRDYKIFNITGRLIATRKSLLQKELKKGIYFIKTKKKTFKIIKLR